MNVFERFGSSSQKHSNSKLKPLDKDKADRERFLAMSELLNTSGIRELTDESSLRVRLFDTLYCCDGRDDHSLSKLFSSYLPTVDFFHEVCSQIGKELRNSKFIGYACVVVLVNDVYHLQVAVKAMKENRHLRYKSKLILKLSNQAILAGKTRSRYNFGCLTPDNTLIMEWCRKQHAFTKFDFADVLFDVLSKPFSPLQLVLKEYQGTYTVETTNSDLFIYSINPALAIIINNYYFTSPHTIREGSEQDVVHLIRELKIVGIPYILIEDCTRSELLEIFDYIEEKDFSPVKSFFIFLMSHGDSDNVLYTHDGQLDINEDIVNRVQSNKSLANAEKLIVVNACRGSIDMDYADPDDMEQIKPTEHSHLEQSTMILYGVPNGVQSPRCPKTGCPFIKSFCRNFRNIDVSDDIQMVDNKIDRDLRRLDYFFGLEKCSELLLKNSEQRHNIIQLPMKAMHMWNLMQSISKDFPIRESNNNDPMVKRLLYVCGTLNRTKFPKPDIMWKYFAPDLEYDSCSVDEDIDHLSVE